MSNNRKTFFENTQGCCFVSQNEKRNEQREQEEKQINDLRNELIKSELEKNSICATIKSLEKYYAQALESLEDTRKQLNLAKGARSASISVMKSDELFQKSEVPKIYSSVSGNTVPLRETLRNPADFLPESLLDNRVKPEKLVELLEQYDIISFDIFDTLILRKFDKPTDVFRYVGHCIGEESFYKMRIQAEQAAREINEDNNFEVNIYEIYDELEKLLKIDKDMVLQKELQAERECCYANPYMKQVFDMLIKKKKKILIISDMYLTQVMLNDLLHSCGYHGYADMFVSCEYRFNKGNGALQKIAAKKYPEAKNIIHIGDNRLSDIEGSKKIGWDSVYYKACREIGEPFRLNEMHRLSVSAYNSVVNSHLHAGEKVYSAYYEHGFRYAGYLIAGFCEWLNEYARNNNIDKILFLARDADILYKVYNKYYKKVDNEYVVVSRLAMWEMAFESNPEEFIQNFFKTRADIGKQTIREALEESDLEKLIPLLENKKLSQDDCLNAGNYRQVHDFLLENYEQIVEHFSNAKAAGQTYLKDVIGSSKNVCAVDIGWTGQILITMRKQVKEIFGNCVNLTGTYMALSNNQDASGYVESGIITPYVFHSAMNQDVAIHTASIEGDMQAKFMEATFTSSEPTLLKFVLTEEGKVEFQYGIRTADKYKIDEIQKGILDFVEVWNKQMNSFNKYIKIMPADAMHILNCAIKNMRYSYAIFGDNLEWLVALPNYKGLGTITTLGAMLKERGLIGQE